MRVVITTSSTLFQHHPIPQKTVTGACGFATSVLGGDARSAGSVQDAALGKSGALESGEGCWGWGSRRTCGSLAPTALGARRAPPAALGAAGCSEPPPPQLSQSLGGERGGVRGAVKRSGGRQVSRIAALCALGSPNSQPVGGAPAYRAQPTPGPAATSSGLVRDPLRTNPGPARDPRRTCSSQATARRRLSPPSAARSSGHRCDSLSALRSPSGVAPRLDRDAPRRLERESRPVGTREVRGGVRVAVVLGNRDPNALRRPRGSSPPADRDLCRAHVSAAGAAGRARDWTRLLPPRSLQRTGQEASALPEPGGPAPRGAGRDAWARPFHARLQSVVCGPLLEFPPGPPGCVVCRHCKFLTNRKLSRKTRFHLFKLEASVGRH